MRRKTTGKIWCGDPVDIPAAEDIGENYRVKEEIGCALSTEEQNSIEKTMPQPFKLFLDLL